MPTMNLYNSFYDAITFITRRFMVPERIVKEAADAAARVIDEYFRGQRAPGQEDPPPQPGGHQKS